MNICSRRVEASTLQNGRNATKYTKNNKKYVAKGLTNRYNNGQKGRKMPNQPDVNKVIRSIQIPLELMARLRILAKERKMTVTQLISFILHEELDRIQLKEEDYEWIKEQVQKNERKRRNG